MHAVVNHDQLGPTALFGIVNLPIAALDGEGYSLNAAPDLRAPDFALLVAAQPVLPDPQPAALRLRDQAQLPFELSALPVDLKYQIIDRFALVGLDRLQIPVAGDPAATSAFRVHPSTLALLIGVDSWQAVLTASSPALAGPTVASVHIGTIEFHVTDLAFTESGVTPCEAAIKPGTVAFANQANL